MNNKLQEKAREARDFRILYNGYLELLKDADQILKDATDFIDNNADNFSKEDVDFMLTKINTCGE